MACTITFLGHSGFIFTDGKYSLVVDPFLTGNPVATLKPSDISCQYVALTHGHSDHVGDSLAIVKANDATLIGTFEIIEYAAEQGVTKSEPSNLGGKIKTDFGSIAFTQAFHSSSFNGRYMGMPCGLIIQIGGQTIYHCGDTALFSDMKLIGEIYKPNIACIPVGDRFTMGPEHGKIAAEMIGAKIAIPIHYQTFPLFVSDISAFQPQGIAVKKLAPGEAVTY